MFRIAFDLGRTALMALGQHAGRGAAHLEGRREEQRLAGNHLLGSAHVRHNRFSRLACARSQPRQSQRRAHELQKFPSTRLIAFPLRRLPRKFTMQEVEKLARFGELFEALPEARSLGPGELCANSFKVERCAHQR